MHINLQSMLRYCTIYILASSGKLLGSTKELVTEEVLLVGGIVNPVILYHFLVFTNETLLNNLQESGHLIIKICVVV